jgi:hypothetical protein
VTSEPTSRDERLAQALRANLHRRKAQSRARRGSGSQDLSASPVADKPAAGKPAADKMVVDAPSDAASLPGAEGLPGSHRSAAADGDDHG